MLKIGLVLLLFFVAFQVPESNAEKPSASYDDSQLLKSRFLAALHAAKRPAGFDHAESLVNILLSIEKDHGFALQTAAMIRSIEEQSPGFQTIAEGGGSMGIAHYKPLEKAAAKPPKTWLIDAINLTSICIPKDADYNLRYLNFLEKQRWSETKVETAPLRYALYLRMYQRGCISTQDLQSATRSIVPTFLKALRAADTKAGDAGSYLYLLAASGRLDEIPKDILLRYYGAQDHKTGSWESAKLEEPAVLAAQGAYVIASVLKQRNLSISEAEILSVEGALPWLPAAVPYQSAR